MQRPTLELWFDHGSTYSYVAALRAEAVAARAGVSLAWRPFLLGPLFQAQLGIKDSPFNVQPARGRYMWRDVERLCAKHGLAWRRPSAFPRSGILASRVGLLAAAEPWIPEFHRAIFRANFARDEDIARTDVVRAALLEAGAPAPAAEDLLARATTQPAKDALRAATAEAEARGVFGAPTLFAGGEMFFGQDRLEDAVTWCAGADPHET